MTDEETWNARVRQCNPLDFPDVLWADAELTRLREAVEWAEKQFTTARKINKWGQWFVNELRRRAKEGK